MLICKNCSLNEICKTYDFILNTYHANININNCKHYKINNVPIIENIESNSNDNKEKKSYPQNNPQYCGQAKPDLKELENKINNVKAKKKPQLIKCPNCKGTTYDDDIVICEKCGLSICSNCSTSDNGHNYCDDCWKNL